MRPKKRDAEATKERILDCARIEFAARGYDNSGLRDIARCAGVNVALINRYFGSKRQLFAQSVLPYFNIVDYLEGDLSDLPARLAASYSSKERVDEGDPVLALLRSAGSPEVGPEVREALSRQVIAPIADSLGGEDAKARASMLISVLGGYDLFRRIIGLSEMNADAPEAVQSMLETTLAQLMGGERTPPTDKTEA